MQITLTTAGLAALVNADNSGAAAVPIGAVAFGRGDQPAAPDRTGLEHEVTRLDTIAGEAVSDRVIHVTVRDASDAAYTVREFGLYTDAGVLFGIYSQSEPIIEKSAGSWLLLDADIEFMGVDVSQISFGDVSFSNPPWSESVKGVVNRATQGQAEKLTDNATGMSPLRTAQAIASWLNATKPGADGGLDADLLDGEQGADYHKADKLTGKAPRNVLPAATTAGAGAVERATVDEADAGSDDVRYMTPAKVKRVLPTPATTERAGLVERATDREAGQGDDTTRYISPAQLHAVVQAMINRQRDIDWRIGSTYTNISDPTNPGEFLPGTWTQVTEGFLYPQGAPESGASGSTGGETSVRLSNKHNGPHHHEMTGTTLVGGNDGHDNYINYQGGGDNTFYTRAEAQTGESGRGEPHNNMPPYLTVYIWQRVS